MDLSDALGDWPNNQSGGGGAWPGQNNNPTWPGQPSNPTWPGAPPQPSGPAGPGGWPSGPSQPANPSWPGGPSGPSGPSGPGGWPSGPSQPANPSWPAGPAVGPGPGPGPSFPVAPQMNLAVPFKQQFPSGLRDKMLITIAGTVKPHPNMFTIDFCSASDLVFHFNPRFNDEGKKTIVRNSQIRNAWGKEERDMPRFPFGPGQNFEMKFLVTSSSFKVAVNNSHLVEFKHREQNLGAIVWMKIYNDVTLSKVNVENLP
ncbi:galectin-3b isoform X2 [Eucyclogobius newberryi]|uniref:galectin-3b isoform X2 n=1 Tax=Eucyclogobius newberryi TaxID=166745 RepID=UPI003B5C7D57